MEFQVTVTEFNESEYQSVVYNDELPSFLEEWTEMNPSTFVSESSDSLVALSTPNPNKMVTWINFDGDITQEIADKFSSFYHFHSVLKDSLLKSKDRPKFERYGDFSYFSLNNCFYSNNRISTSRRIVVFSKYRVISFREKNEHHIELFDLVRKRIQQKKSRIRKQGASFLALNLLNAVIEHVFQISSQIESDLNTQEKKILEEKDTRILQDVYLLRSEIKELYHNVFPISKIIFSIKEELQFIKKKEDQTQFLYLSTLEEHSQWLIREIEFLRDSVKNLIELYHIQVNYQMSKIMKVLAIISTIFIPLNLIAAIYGMNFQNMPELKIKWFYPLVIGFMITLSSTMLFIFKRKKWF